MDIHKEREAFQKFCEENFDFERHEQTYFDEKTQCYENDMGEDTESINMAWSAWQAAKAQAVPDLSELQERIAGHQYYHDEHSHMIVDMDDVVKEISGFDSWKAQEVPEGFVLVEKPLLSDIHESCVACLEIVSDKSIYKSLLMTIRDEVAPLIEAQEPAND